MNKTEFGTAKIAWDLKSGFGNHRFIVRAPRSDYARAVIPWRRRDDFYDKTILRIQYKKSEDEDKPVGDGEIFDCYFENRSRFFATVVFRAPVEGIYELYYMPFEMPGPWWAANTVYTDSPRVLPCRTWLDGAADAEFSECEILRYESRTAHDSFYPMEFVMTPDEYEDFSNTDVPFFVIAESRLRPVKMRRYLPYIWTQRSDDRLSLDDTVAANEHYAFQLAVCACQDICGLTVRFYDGDRNEYGIDNCFCINTHCVDTEGVEKTLTVDVSEGDVLPLWCCVDAENIKADKIEIFAEIKSENTEQTEIARITLSKSNEILERNGDNELWRFSRLFRLNSKIGLSNEVIDPYEPLRIDRDKSVIDMLGRSVTVGKNGLPSKVLTYYNDRCLFDNKMSPASLLAEPFSYSVKINGKAEEISYDTIRIEEEGTLTARVKTSSYGKSFRITGDIAYEADGFIDGRLTVFAEEDSRFELRLTTSFDAVFARYMIGMCREGGATPEVWGYAWEQERNGNIGWIGGPRAGLQIKLLQDGDHWGGVNPLPESWSSGGGKMRVEKEDEGRVVRFTAYSGKKYIEKGQHIVFHFHMMVTPLHPVDYRSHFTKHYYHSNSWHSDEPVVSLERALQFGADTVILHQGGPLNENINYPFHLADKLKAEVDRAHTMGLKYKIYYTVRELSNFAEEIWAFRSLGDEIYRKGNDFKVADYFAPENERADERTTGGPWLIEHLGDGYTPAWHQPLSSGEYDCAVGTQSKSRLNNYYLMGLKWLAEVVGIDGVYLDGIGYDRKITRRLRRVLNEVKSGCDVDIHLGNEHLKVYGSGSPACEYLEHFAYADKVWIGEGYDYVSQHPDFFLTEVSALLFGLTSEMLEGGGNPWRGMIYGMTTRAGWSQGGLTLPIWKLWNEFGICDAEMIGYWEPSCPVGTENDLIKATAYVRPDGEILIAVASWYPVDRECIIFLDRCALGIEGDCEFYAPYIENFQNEESFPVRDPIPVSAGKGWLFNIRKKH